MTSRLAGLGDEVWPRYEETFEELRPRLSTDEQLYTAWQFAESREERHEIAERRFELYDGAYTTGYQLAGTALPLGRLHQALGAIDAQDFEHPQISHWPLAWMVRGQIYHLTGDYERELTRAREGRARMPEWFGLRFYETRALLALDQEEQALAVYGELTEIPTTAQSVDPTSETRRLWNALHEASFEFARHASTEAEERALEVFAEWALGRDDLSAWQRGQTYYRLGRYSEAIPLLEEALEEYEGVRRIPIQALLVIGLEQSGDPEAAGAIERSITYPPGSSDWRRVWQALPPATRGDVDETLRILGQAYADGVLRYPGTEDFMHFRTEWAPLWDDPRFDRLMHPERN